MANFQNGIFVVIPALNEGEVIVEHIRPLCAAYRVVVVDDGSTDATWDALKSASAIRLRHPVNLGQGASLQTGMDFAVAHGAEIVVHFDADGQHDPAQIPDLLAPILSGAADVVFGSRFLEPSDREHVPVAKRWVLKAGIVVSGLITGVWLTDTHNGFRALSRKAAQTIRLKENRAAHATEIMEAVRRANLKYVEVPVTVRYTQYSRAKGQPILNSINIVLDLMLRRLFP